MTVSMNSHTTENTYRMIEKIYTISADSMIKRAKRTSESYEQSLSKM